jgi:hypothetical protein
MEIISTLSHQTRLQATDSGVGQTSHRIWRLQIIQNVYEFLDEIEQIRMQALNRRHYERLIPSMLYVLNSFGQRLISLNQR